MRRFPCLFSLFRPLFRPLFPLIPVLAGVFVAAGHLQAAPGLPPAIHRILFLGDSITQSGEYVDYVEAGLILYCPERQFDVLDLGLASETVSGLSEPGHAGGKFPRPDLHERLDRVLAKTAPQLIFACYGMNDGIYLPLAEDRFARFRQGMELLHQKATAAGAQIIHLTPPAFDPVRPLHDGESNYNDTLDAYSQWLLDQRARGWQVFDLHGPMKAELAAGRAADPQFRFAKDGIHPNAAGHWIMAREILRGLGLPTTDFPGDSRYVPLVSLVRQRGRVLWSAWLSETGHKRPGIPPGLPLKEANVRAASLLEKIQTQAAALKK